MQINRATGEDEKASIPPGARKGRNIFIRIYLPLRACPRFDTPVSIMRQSITIEKIVAEIVRDSKMTLRALEERTGINKSRISRIIRGEGKLGVDELQILGLTLGFDAADVFRTNENLKPEKKEAKIQSFSDINAQFRQFENDSQFMGGGEVTIDAMLRWHERTQGVLIDIDKAMPYLVTAQVQDDGTSLPLSEHIGPLSLVATSLRTRDPTFVRNYLSELPSRKRDEISGSYHEVHRSHTYRVFNRTIPVELKGIGRKLELTYATLLQDVKDLSGKRFVSNFSTLISTRFLDSELEEHQDCEKSNLRVG